MKYLSENQNNNGANNSNNSCFANWLGFSLSPHMKMEEQHQQQQNQYHDYHNHHPQQQSENQQQQTPVSTMSMFLSAQHHHQQQQQQEMNSGAGVCFDVGVGGDSNSTGGFLHTPLTVMPLKSDGSLCIMEALSRSQHSQVASVPKLEDFLGSGQERETMALSLDSYYQQTAEQESHRQQQQEQQQQQQQFESYISAAMAYQGFTEEGLFKNWINGTTINNMNSSTGGYVDNGGHGSSSVTLAVAPAAPHSAPLSCGGGELQSLSLSMSPGSQSSCVTTTATTTASPDCGGVNVMENSKKRALGNKQATHRKSIDTFGQRTSQFRGVTKHRWTGRYEAHLWDNSCKKEGQTRKGRQVYLGGYDMEEKAARAYDLAALKYWGVQTHINYPVENYKFEIEEMKNMTRQEYVAHLRRKSSGFSRGASIYRGVTRHHQHGRWQARIGRVSGNKDLYLGTFSTQEEAAEAYDVAAIKFRGLNAVTNFDINRYDVDKIMASNTLVSSDQARRNNVERIEAVLESPSAQNAGVCGANDWKMVSYIESQTEHQQASTCVNNGEYNRNPNPSFELALQDLDATKLTSAHFSNASSLVTSLNSSREASPDRNGCSSSSLLSSKGLQLASGLVNQASVVSPWIAGGQLRPSAIPVAHLPVFAAWGDA